MSGVGLSIETMGNMITDLFVNTLFGMHVLVGLFITLIVFFWIIKHSGSNNKSVVIFGMSALIIWLGGTSFGVLNGVGEWTNPYLPSWVSGVVIVLLLALFAVGSYRMWRTT